MPPLRIGLRTRLLVGLLTVQACGWGEPPVCEGSVTELAPDLRCETVAPVLDLVEALAGRRLDLPKRRRILRELKVVATRDRRGLDDAIADARATLAALDDGDVWTAAEARSTMLWNTLHGADGAGVLAGLPEARAVLDAHTAVWEHDDEARQVLTEMEVEGWIRYVSLLREVQGAGPLAVAISDKVAIYRTVRERWRASDTAGRTAFGVLGLAWPDARVRWLGASWEKQQAAVDRLPLPPPMTATSTGYLEAVTAMDVAAHVRALDAGLGPLGRRLP